MAVSFGYKSTTLPAPEPPVQAFGFTGQGSVPAGGSFFPPLAVVFFLHGLNILDPLLNPLRHLILPAQGLDFLGQVCPSLGRAGGWILPPHKPGAIGSLVCQFLYSFPQGLPMDRHRFQGVEVTENRSSVSSSHGKGVLPLSFLSITPFKFMVLRDHVCNIFIFSTNEYRFSVRGISLYSIGVPPFA